MATISIMANRVRPSVDRRSDDTAFGAGTFLKSSTDRNPVRSLLEFSTKAAFPSTTLESLVLDWEVK